MRDRVAAFENITLAVDLITCTQILFYSNSNHIVWNKQAQSIKWTQSLFIPVWSCHFPSNAKYSVL